MPPPLDGQLLVQFGQLVQKLAKGQMTLAGSSVLAQYEYLRCDKKVSFVPNDVDFFIDAMFMEEVMNGINEFCEEFDLVKQGYHSHKYYPDSVWYGRMERYNIVQVIQFKLGAEQGNQIGSFDKVLQLIFIRFYEEDDTRMVLRSGTCYNTVPSLLTEDTNGSFDYACYMFGRKVVSQFDIDIVKVFIVPSKGIGRFHLFSDTVGEHIQRGVFDYTFQRVVNTNIVLARISKYLHRGYKLNTARFRDSSDMLVFNGLVECIDAGAYVEA